MGCGRWKGLAAILALVGLATGPEAAERPEVVVHVDNRTQVPASDLVRARTVVEEIFTAAGVRITWQEERLLALPTGDVASLSRISGVPHVYLVLGNNADRATDGANGCALGLAVRARSTGYAFYNRIVELSLLRQFDAPIVLGRVIAHEIGHLLLPPNSHSRYGIMRGDLDLGYRNPARLTEDHARAIRAGFATLSVKK
jgi:hypothetical protein